LEAKSMGPWTHSGKLRGQPPKVAKWEEEKQEDWPDHVANAVQPSLCQCWAHLWQEEGPQCQLLSLCNPCFL
jgi:hypothetical protein